MLRLDPKLIRFAQVYYVVYELSDMSDILMCLWHGLSTTSASHINDRLSLVTRMPVVRQRY